MTRRDRLMATLQGRPVDRPAVSFYELNGLDEDPFNHDPYNIYNLSLIHIYSGRQSAGSITQERFVGNNSLSEPGAAVCICRDYRF